MSTLVVVYVIALVQAGWFVLSTALLARALGAQVTKAGLGMPALVTLQRAPVEVRWGPIPSASVELLGRGEDVGDPRAWRRLGLARRVAILLGPWLGLLVVALACLGPRAAIASIAHGFAQLLVTLDLTPLLRAFLARAAAAPVTWTIGVVLAKLLAMNLLPFGGLAGGGLIQEIATPRDGAPARGVQVALAATILAILWIFVRLVWAFGAVLMAT